ncbi:MAG: hypothetical protein Q7S40_15950 [Opitutaceae bacterium]|nr:hypothetical protein [Opitutaceae bacterium]
MASATVAQAQERKKGGMSPEQQIAQIEQQVGSLTDAEKKKVTAIFEKTREAMKGVSKESRKEEMPKMMKKQSDEIAAALTPEHREKYLAAMASKKGGSGGGKKKNQ